VYAGRSNQAPIDAVRIYTHVPYCNAYTHQKWKIIPTTTVRIDGDDQMRNTFGTFVSPLDHTGNGRVSNGFVGSFE
jgi:hypothetical protein